MHAQVADRLVVHGARVGQPDRVGEIVELVGSHGAQRFRVRWSDGHESIYTPAAGALGRAPEKSAERPSASTGTS